MIDLGYEIGTGKRVKIPLNHMAILGQTQLSGKTTTMEAVAIRSDVRAISFITKPGEKSFRQRNVIPAFFSESTIEEYWKYVVAIVENLMSVKLGWQERGWIVKLCQDYERKHKDKSQSYKWKRPKSLADLLNNVAEALPHLRGTSEMVCMQLQEYLRPAVKEIARTQFSAKLELKTGINVMDVTELSDGLKALVIRSVIEWVHKHGRRIVVIIPEAWKFIPEGRSTPVKLALEGLIREGAGVGNFVWMDSQDLRGVDKMLLRSVIVWLFGVQRQKNEVANTLASIPDHPKPSATEIMQLGKGQFFVAFGNTLVRTYVQPAGMADEHAQAIARGEERPETWGPIAKSLDDEKPEQETAAAPAEDREDEMWKEKYDELAEEHKHVVEAHDALAARVRDLERRIRVSEEAGETVLYAPSSSADVPTIESGAAVETAAEAAPPSSRFPRTGDPTIDAVVEYSLLSPKQYCDIKRPAATVGEKFAEMSADSRFEALYRAILQRAAKENPKTLAVLLHRHELLVTVERQVIHTNAGQLKGALGILISEKFLDNVRVFADVRTELIRRGFLNAKAPNQQISQALMGLVEMGFLTKEETGYQAVAGMKVNIVEAK